MRPILISPTLVFRVDSRNIPWRLPCSRKKCWFHDCASPEKAQGNKAASMAKKRKEGKEKTMKGRSQKSNPVEALKRKRWNVFINNPRWQKLRKKGKSEDVQLLWGRKEHASIENSFCNACTLLKRLTYCCTTHLEYICCMYIWSGQCGTCFSWLSL